VSEDEGPPPKLMPWTFWAALAFGLAMVLAGLALGLVWPHLTAHPGPQPGALTAPMVHGKGAGRISRSPTSE
jgi:hypothetical protein